MKRPDPFGQGNRRNNPYETASVLITHRHRLRLLLSVSSSLFPALAWSQAQSSEPVLMRGSNSVPVANTWYVDEAGNFVLMSEAQRQAVELAQLPTTDVTLQTLTEPSASSMQIPPEMLKQIMGWSAAMGGVAGGGLVGSLALTSGMLRGPEGPEGPAGPAGPPGDPASGGGLSAYEVAVNDGFVGSEQDWLNSLVGPTGATGPQGLAGAAGAAGAAGSDGQDGENGSAGSDGSSAYQVWVAAGNSGSEQDFLNSLVGDAGATGNAGSDGKSAYQIWIDAGNTGTYQTFLDGLVGATGATGGTGAAGQDGSEGDSAYDIWVDAGNIGTEEDFLNSLVTQNDPTAIQAPTISQIYVSEETVLNTSIGDLDAASVSTQTEDTNLSYSVTDAFSKNFISLDSAGVVRLATELDYEATQSFTSNILIQDNYDNYINFDFQIVVTDELDEIVPISSNYGYVSVDAFTNILLLQNNIQTSEGFITQYFSNTYDQNQVSSIESIDVDWIMATKNNLLLSVKDNNYTIIKDGSLYDIIPRNSGKILTDFHFYNDYITIIESDADKIYLHQVNLNDELDSSYLEFSKIQYPFVNSTFTNAVNGEIYYIHDISPTSFKAQSISLSDFSLGPILTASLNSQDDWHQYRTFSIDNNYLYGFGNNYTYYENEGRMISFNLTDLSFVDSQVMGRNGGLSRPIYHKDSDMLFYKSSTTWSYTDESLITAGVSQNDLVIQSISNSNEREIGDIYLNSDQIFYNSNDYAIGDDGYVAIIDLNDWSREIVDAEYEYSIDNEFQLLGDHLYFYGDGVLT